MLNTDNIDVVALGARQFVAVDPEDLVQLMKGHRVSLALYFTSVPLQVVGNELNLWILYCSQEFAIPGVLGQLIVRDLDNEVFKLLLLDLGHPINAFQEEQSRQKARSLVCVVERMVLHDAEQQRGALLE